MSVVPPAVTPWRWVLFTCEKRLGFALMRGSEEGEPTYLPSKVTPKEGIRIHTVLCLTPGSAMTHGMTVGKSVLIPPAGPCVMTFGVRTLW